MQSPISDSKKCQVSRLAGMTNIDPKQNKNYRNNPCLLIHTAEGRNIIFDVGKTFREGALRWMSHLDVNTTLDAVVLTHHHMDASGGLDDLRGFQGIQRDDDDNWSRIPIQVYMSQYCHSELQNQFPWLFPKRRFTKTQGPRSEGQPIVKRDVASLDVTLFDNYQPFVVFGVTITPLAVWHGEDLICHGFIIEVPTNSIGTGSNGGDTTTIVYLSDISRMIPKTLEYIQSKVGNKVDYFICDALLWHDPHPVHYSLAQAIEMSQQHIRPRKGTYTVGMNCDNYLPHDEMNHWLRQNITKQSEKEDEPNGGGGSDLATIQFAHDGLVIEL